MRRLFAATACAAMLLAGIACSGNGDDSDDNADDTGNGDETQAANETPEPTNTRTDEEEATARLATSTPVPPLPTPTPVPADVPSIEVLYAGSIYAPTLSQFQALEQTSLSGIEGEGVLLSTLAAQVGAPAGALVTIQGLRSDSGTAEFLRDSLGNIGGTVLFVPGSDGHIGLVTTSWSEPEWLTIVTSITFE